LKAKLKEKEVTYVDLAKRLKKHGFTETEDIKPIEVSPHAFAEAVARDPAKALGVSDSVVDRRRPQRPGVSLWDERRK
jgi:hypothetical protein